MSRTRFKIIYVPLALMMLLGVLMIGVTDFIMVKFDPSIFTKATFWTNIICTNIGILCLILSILLMKNDNFKQEDQSYLECQEHLDTFYKTKFIAPVFKKFCYDKTIENKIYVYKLKINKQYTKIKPTKEDLDIFYGKDEDAKKTNEYCNKIVYYNYILSKEYINDNIHKIHIKHDPITDSLVFTGILSKDIGPDYITKHKGWKVFKDLLPKFLLSFAIVFLMSSLLPDPQEGISLIVIYKTISKLFTIISQIFFAFNYADKYNQEVTLHDIRFRETLLNEYIVWEQRQQKLVEQKKQIIAEERKEATE